MNETKKSPLHERNIFSEDYPLSELIKQVPSLEKYLVETPSKKLSVDFKNPEAVFLLNKSLLEYYYSIKDWKIIKNSLCPSVPGRADYIHYVADLIGHAKNEKTDIMDIGTGSSLIYPLLGASIYQWNFVATESHLPSYKNTIHILGKNTLLRKKIEVRHQKNQKSIFEDSIKEGEYYHAVMCNPPFYKSREEQWNKTVAKNEKLFKSADLPVKNFGGLDNELWCDGGEKKFVLKMIEESLKYRSQIGWCTSLIADKTNLNPLISVLEYNKIEGVRTIPMKQGQKASRILAWKLS